jgi:hypothetical protein
MITDKNKFILYVVYKNQENEWRGFCCPYDVSCVAETKEKTFIKLKKMVSLYQEGLKKYNYPKHLSIKELSNKEDKKIFELVKKEIIKRISKDLFYRGTKRENIQQDLSYEPIYC